MESTASDPAAEPRLFDSVEDAICALREGRMIILADDEERENEGDLVCAAEHITPAHVNFMTKQGGGLICLAMEGRIVDQLGLPLMVNDNQNRFETNFTVSIEAREGVTTGISAADRARTILTAVRPGATRKDLSSPGHVFPLRAREGGVLVRAGQTEGAVDLARFAGLTPAGVICEILDEDGSMARYPSLRRFADRNQIKYITISGLIAYRKACEKHAIERIATCALPTRFGSFQLIAYRHIQTQQNCVALIRGSWTPEEAVLVRVHSQCLTGDVLGSLRCDCGQQLHQAMRFIADEDCGILLYLPQEGRGIGLGNKILAYQLQEQGADTVEANHRLGFKGDLREYGVGAQILHDLGVRRMRLITNNPRKIVGLSGHGLEVVERVPIRIDSTTHNAGYLQTKKHKLGHLL